MVLQTVFAALRALYNVPFLFILPIKLIPRRLRPHRTYTYQSAMAVEIARRLFEVVAWFEPRMAYRKEAGKLGERWVEVPAAPAALLAGPAGRKQAGGIESEVRHGLWVPHLYRPDEDAERRVVLQFHGGAHVLVTADMMEGSRTQDVLVDGTGSMVFFADYRLASHPDSHFPASLQDAIAAYAHLVRDLRIAPSRIVICGNSAGGNLAIALLRYLNEFPHQELPPPAAAVLISPWVDLAVEGDVLRKNRNARSDFMAVSALEWGVRKYTNHGAVSANHPYINPVAHPFACKSPLLITFGQAEVFADSIVHFAETMKEIPGNSVLVLDQGYVPHDALSIPPAFGFEEETVRDSKKILEFFNSVGV